MAPKSLKRKPVAEIWSEPHRQQSQCPRPADILMQWKQSLSDEIVIIENTYCVDLLVHLGLLRRLLQKVRSSLKGPLLHAGISSNVLNADILHRSERFLPRDRG